jgi:hypothetical protein
MERWRDGGLVRSWEGRRLFRSGIDIPGTLAAPSVLPSGCFKGDKARSLTAPVGDWFARVSLEIYRYSGAKCAVVPFQRDRDGPEIFEAY